MKTKAAVLLLVVLSACGVQKKSDFNETPAPPPTPRTRMVVQSKIYVESENTDFWHGTIDGRECIVAYTYHGVSVNCDWSTK